MAIIAKVYRDELPELKQSVKSSCEFFKKARIKFNETRRFVLKSNITEEDKNDLAELNIPALQFNSLEAYVSRLLGEFSKQEPSLEVQAAPLDVMPDADMVDYVEGHLRAIFNKFNRYEIYRDQLTGGFSAIRLVYDYESEKSLEHKIYAERVYDPLLVGFDPTAREKHKGDGEYCFELYPKTEDDLKEMYPDVSFDDIKESYSENFKWVYEVGNKKVYLLCEYYKKIKKRTKIHRLSDNSTVTQAEYENLIKTYEKEQRFAQPPVIVQTRKTTVTIIRCYKFFKNKMLEVYDTDYSILPIIFVDGNSVLLRKDSENSDVEQVVKPYVENAMDAQRLKNLSGQQLANGIETMIQHKMKIAQESIPNGCEDLYTNVQYAGNYVYKSYDDRDRPLPPPQEVMKVPLPPEIMGTFNGADQIIQSILGSYDAALGINNNQLSGVAIVEGATQSNSTAMPYIVNLLDSLQQLANGILDLIPKLYVTPRSIPIITAENKKAFILINSKTVPDNGKYHNKKPIKISYNSQDLHVVVKPGVNFEVQQQRALDTAISLSKMLPSFAAILNGKGLPILFENINVRGADRWRLLAEQQVEMQEQQQAQQQQQGQQQAQFNPMVQKIALEQQKMVLGNQIKQAELGLKQQQLENERIKMNIDYSANQQDNMVQLKKAETEKQVHEDNMTLKAHEHLHKQASDMIEHAKDIVHRVGDRLADAPVKIESETSQESI